MCIKINSQLNKMEQKTLALQLVYVNIYDIGAICRETLSYIQSWRKKVVTPPFAAIKPIWVELLCFHSIKFDMKCTCDCPQRNPPLPSPDFHLNAKTAANSPNLPSHCGKFESAIAYFFSILTDSSYNALSSPYRY